MKASGSVIGRGLLVAGLAAASLLAGCEVGTRVIAQDGYRGTGMQSVIDRDRLVEAGAIPAALPLAPPGGPLAGETYENIEVLGDLTTSEFNRLMSSITAWVAPPGTGPGQGCNYCHVATDMASDEVYTKDVARRMIQMTRDINANWTDHVQTTGVTCWTCHRGNAVPEYTWSQEAPGAEGTITGNRHGQNRPDGNVGYASLPYDPFAYYVRRDVNGVRVVGASFVPPAQGGATIQTTEQTYGLMMHLSQSLGVNCTFCHNSQSFASWELSRPQRALAYYGLEMVANLNDEYIRPLSPILPANRVGPTGDALQVNCMTCHQGQNRPLGGVSMLADHPELAGTRRAPPSPAPAEPAAAAMPTTAVVEGEDAPAGTP